MANRIHYNKVRGARDICPVLDRSDNGIIMSSICTSIPDRECPVLRVFYQKHDIKLLILGDSLEMILNFSRCSKSCAIMVASSFAAFPIVSKIFASHSVDQPFFGQKLKFMKQFLKAYMFPDRTCENWNRPWSLSGVSTKDFFYVYLKFARWALYTEFDFSARTGPLKSTVYFSNDDVFVRKDISHVPKNNSLLHSYASQGNQWACAIILGAGAINLDERNNLWDTPDSLFEDLRLKNYEEFKKSIITLLLELRSSSDPEISYLFRILFKAHCLFVTILLGGRHLKWPGRSFFFAKLKSL